MLQNKEVMVMEMFTGLLEKQKHLLFTKQKQIEVSPGVPSNNTIHMCDLNSCLAALFEHLCRLDLLMWKSAKKDLVLACYAVFATHVNLGIICGLLKS